MCTDDAIPYSQALDHVYTSGEHPVLFDQICTYWKLEAIYTICCLTYLLRVIITTPSSNRQSQLFIDKTRQDRIIYLQQYPPGG